MKSKFRLLTTRNLFLRGVAFVVFGLLLQTGCEKASSSNDAAIGTDGVGGSAVNGVSTNESKKLTAEELAAFRAADEQLYNLMVDFMAEEDVQSQKWMLAGQAIQTTNMLNCAVLNTKREFDAQKACLQAYVDSTEAYLAFSDSIVARLTEKLRPLEGTPAEVEEAIQEVEADYLLQKPVFDPLMQTHIAYGKTMIQILELLEENQEQWTFLDGETVIYQDSVIRKYDKLRKNLNDYGMTLNTLSEKLNALGAEEEIGE